MFASHVYVSFPAARFKLVNAPLAAAGGRVRVDVDPAVHLDVLTTPFALIARITAAGRSPGTFVFDVDGRTVCDRKVAAVGSHRVDCAVGDSWAPEPHRITIRGPDTGWSLNYLELSTHHGATQRYDLVVVPAGSRRYVPPSARAVLLVGAVLAALFLLPSAAMPRRVRIPYRIFAGLVGGFVLIVSCSAWLSPYGLLLSPVAFAESVVVLGAPRLWFGASWLATRWRRTRRPRWALATIVALLVAGAYGRRVHDLLRTQYQGNFSGFLMLSQARYDADPLVSGRTDLRGTLKLYDGGGYDAQFAYLEAFDPFMRAFSSRPSMYSRFIDAPPYRYGRIGFIWLTDLFSAGRARLFPATMTWLILVSLGAAALALSSAAIVRGASPSWGLLVAAIPGFWQSMQMSLPEPIAAALLLAGYLYWLRRNYVAAGALLACSLLVRETGAVLLIALAGATWIRRERGAALRLFAIGTLPIVAWRLYVGWVLWPAWGLHGVLFTPGDLTVPFRGFVTLWTDIHAGRYYPEIGTLARAGIWYPVLLIDGAALAAWSAVLAPGAITAAAAVYGVIALSLNYPKIWVHVGNGQRGTYELFLMLALVPVALRECSRPFRFALLLFWAGSVAYLLFAAFDAQEIARSVLWPLF